MTRRGQRNQLTIKPTTLVVMGLVLMWFGFQVYSQIAHTVPPPVLDQLLVGTFGVWFTSEAVEKKRESSKRRRDDDDEEDDDDDRRRRLPRGASQ